LPCNKVGKVPILVAKQVGKVPILVAKWVEKFQKS
jgi:hypothetical protein